MSIAMTPPPAYATPSVPAEIRLAPTPRAAHPSELDSFQLSDRSTWAPPANRQMLATVQPIFSSQVRHHDVTVEEVRAAVHQILTQQEEGDGPISDVEGRGLSYEAAARLSLDLQEAGFRAHFAEVNHDATGHEISADGESVRGKSTGLVVVEGGSEPIFVDGAVRQWFADPEAQQQMPSVFVGTASDFQKLAAEHPEDLQLVVDGDPQTGNYHPAEFALYVLGEDGSRTLLD